MSITTNGIGLEKRIEALIAAGLLDWCLRHGFQLRFIEQMPLDAERGWTREGTITAEQIRRRLAERFELSPHPEPRAHGHDPEEGGPGEFSRPGRSMSAIGG